MILLGGGEIEIVVWKPLGEADIAGTGMRLHASKREMRAATVAISLLASRVMRCHVTVFKNFPTESPPV